MSKEKKVVEIDNKKKEAEKTTKAKSSMKEIFSISEQLESELKEINRKKKLVDNRNFFIVKKEELKTCVEELKGEVEGNQFNTTSFSLKLSRSDRYRDDKNAFSISNVDILLKFTNMLMSEINSSIKKIEGELLK